MCFRAWNWNKIKVNNLVLFSIRRWLHCIFTMTRISFLDLIWSFVGRIFLKSLNSLVNSLILLLSRLFACICLLFDSCAVTSFLGLPLLLRLWAVLTVESILMSSFPKPCVISSEVGGIGDGDNCWNEVPKIFGLIHIHSRYKLRRVTMVSTLLGLNEFQGFGYCMWMLLR